MIKHASYVLCVLAGLIIIIFWLFEGDEPDLDSIIWPAMGLYFIGKGLFIKTLYDHLPPLKKGNE